ncbi:MAG: glycosyltransferase family 2 protein [Prevotellaceae bacterium]|jgi:GT2 family glycosyltransferase|nr:glycosyltransferase family 2 protein [Prevotellaceae bacterium]
MTQSLVSIITVNYNGWQDTCQLIDSLRQHETYPYEIIVVDNHSQGDDVERIRAAHPEVTVIASMSNRGFAGGNNLGAAAARGEYLFFLNNDTLVRTPILETLVGRLEASPRNGGVSPMIKYYAGEQPIQYAGFTPFTSITLRNHALAYDQPDDGTTWHTPVSTPYLHGAAMMIPRRVVEQVGLMFEGYFLFYEEFDYSMTIRRAQYELWYEPTAVVYHKGEQSITPTSPLREYYLTRSRMIYARRNCRGWRKPVSYLYLLLIATPRKALLHLFKGRYALSSAVLRGAFCGFISSKTS